MSLDRWSVVKKELNNIYTEPPHDVAGRGDLGWFCREHAFHTYILGLLLNLPISLIHGHILLRSQHNTLLTLNDKSGHAWCSIAAESGLVDLSVSTQYYPNMKPVELVFGSTVYPEGVYTLFESADYGTESLYALAGTYEEVAIYVPKSSATPQPQNLLRKPFSYLFPPAGGAPSLTDEFGRDIFSRITFHCYLLYMQEVESLYATRDGLRACKFIQASYPRASNELEKMLQQR